MVAHTYNPSTLGGQGRWITGGQEFKTSLTYLGLIIIFRDTSKLCSSLHSYRCLHSSSSMVQTTVSTRNLRLRRERMKELGFKSWGQAPPLCIHQLILSFVVSTEVQKISRTWWCVPVPATREAEAENCLKPENGSYKEEGSVCCGHPPPCQDVPEGHPHRELGGIEQGVADGTVTVNGNETEMEDGGEAEDGVQVGVQAAEEVPEEPAALH
ncbi:hypothetical protein AAY473_007486 [Plecturocebus cupreus]